MEASTLNSIPSEIRIQIFSHLFKPVYLIVHKEPALGDAKIEPPLRGSYPDLNIFYTSRKLLIEARTALASCIRLSYHSHCVPDPVAVPKHFASFYFPRIRHLHISLLVMHTFDPTMFPALRYLTIGGCCFWYFGYLTVYLNSPEEVAALLGGAKHAGIIEDRRQAWAEPSSSADVKKVQELVADESRCFEIIDEVNVAILLNGRDFGTMVSKITHRLIFVE
jgi:hypothetical protein